MSSSKLVRNVRVVDTVPGGMGTGVRIARAFTPSFTGSLVRPASPPAFPRNASELEQVVSQRVASAEDRHREECEAAFQRGIEEGLTRQHGAIDQKLAMARKPIAQLTQALTDHMAKEKESFAVQVTEIASALTRSLVGRLVEINPAAFLPALRDALEPLAHMSKVRVRMNPRDLDTLRTALGDEDVLFQGLPDLELVTDPQIDVGGAVAESRGGSVDARVTTRMQAALALLESDPDAG
jgi:flagellar biosynthesis/type III secretory pathway protein FliH